MFSENHILKVTDSGRKSGRFLYEVIKKATGDVISQRRSNNSGYVAATVNGAFYFGRLDLVGKGDHGRAIKRQEVIPEALKIAKLESI
jgi:hypothetical protein